MIITLKDGSTREYGEPMSIYDIAKDISEGLARVACVGEVNGEVKDLRTVIDSDCELNILTFDSDAGKHAYRHTCSHVLAEAVLNLYPEAKLAIGPSIDTGFYYDFDMPPLTREDLDKIGNIRSLRDYYAYWAFEWDAFLVHFGGPFFINELLEQPDTQDIDGTSGTDEGAFFRTTDRNKPHNAYASGAGLLRVIGQKGYSLEYRGLSDEEHFRFATKAEPNTLGQYGSKAKDATYIDMSGCYPLTRCYFEFNEDDGLYYRSQHLSGSTDGPHIDALTGKQLTFKNILVQNTFYEELGEGYLAFQCHDTTRDGWFFTNGRGIHVNWEKTSDYGATRYYDDNGDEIVLNAGKTMICIVEDGDSFTFH